MTDEMERKEQAMTNAGLSKARHVRMHDVMSGYVERGDVSGLILPGDQRLSVNH